MATIDTSMYRQNPLRSIADYEGEFLQNDLRKQGLQQNALALKTGNLALADRERGIQDQTTIRNALMQLGPNATDESRMAALKGTGLPGGFAQADALDKSILERQKTGAEVKSKDASTEKTALETAIAKQGHIAQLAGTAVDQPSWERAIQLASYIGADVSKLPPQFDPVVAKQLAQTALTSHQQLEARYKEMQLTETGRRNKATEGLTASGQRQQMTIAQMTDERQRELNASTKADREEAKRLERNDKEVTKYSSTLQKEGIPDIEAALSAAEGVFQKFTDPKTGKAGDMPGVGRFTNGLPDWAVSDDGKDVRSSLAAVSNIVLSARSGAAVTDSELRRLARELQLSVGGTAEGMQKAYAKFRDRFEKVKANVSAGVSDEVKGEYEARGGLKIQRGGAKPVAPTGSDPVADALKKYGG